MAALTTSALSLPGLAGSARADAPRDRAAAEYSFSFYAEDHIGASQNSSGSSSERYEVQSHQLHFTKPWSARVDLDLDIMHEVMAGASPIAVTPDSSGQPVQVMSGASIEDNRTDILPKASFYFDRGRASLSAGASIENDYLAFNVGVDGETHVNDKNTSFLGGVGASFDSIEPEDSSFHPLRSDKEKKTSVSVFGGLSQVLSQNATVQSTVSYARSDGFLSDPYKEVFVGGARLADTRPGDRNQASWLTRYRHHFSPVNGSVHADYRFYIDDWQVRSHTIELAWYQSVWDLVTLVPSVRYYSQSQAKFYAPFFDQARSDGFHTSDYRLSPYGALSWGLKAETRFPTGPVDWFARFSWERYISRGNLALGKVGVENPGLVSFHVFSFDLAARF